MLFFSELVLFCSVLAPVWAGDFIPTHKHTVQRRAALCNRAGYDLGKNAYFYKEDASLATQKACGDHCQADVKCKAFAIGKGACLHYDIPAEDNARPDSTSPYNFFDRSCISSAQPSTSTASLAAPQSSAPVTPSTAAQPPPSTTSIAFQIPTPVASIERTPPKVTDQPRIITSDVPLPDPGAKISTTFFVYRPVATAASQNSNTHAYRVNGSGDSSNAPSPLDVSRGLILTGVLATLLHIFA